jgi:hypothetical protein
MAGFLLSPFLRPRAEKIGGQEGAKHPKTGSFSSCDGSVFRLYALDFAHL